MSARPSRGALPPLSLCVSLLALVLAVGGTAYAAGLARNSVGTPQLKKNAVTTPKLKNSAVTGVKVRNGSLRAGDLAAGVVPTSGSLDYSLAPGDTRPTLVLGGVTFEPSCQSGGGTTVVSQVTVRPATAGANNLTVSGTLVRQQGGAPTLTNALYGTGGGSSFEPNAQSDNVGGASTTSFEGTVRSGTGPWMHVSLQAQSNSVQASPCRVRAVVTPVR